jgi:hypothetical protein
MEVYHLIEDFRNHYRRTITAKPSGSSGAFTATLNGTDQNDNKPDAKPCLYGGQHRWSECYYITLSTRPSGWKGKPEIFEQINKKIQDMRPNPKYTTTKAEWFQHKFKYDGLTDTDTDKQSTDTRPSDNKPTKSLGSYATHALYHTNTTDVYKLYDKWTLDGALDVYICNNTDRNGFRKTRNALPDDQLFAGKTSYLIACFGTVSIIVNTPDGPGEITLENVALAPSFMTNLVSLDLLNQQGVHWNSEYPTKLVRDGSDFLNLQRVDRHWVIQTTKYGSFAKNSKLTLRAQVTAEQIHRNLAHASPEVIAHVQKATTDTVVDGTIPAPITIQCETCSVSQATEQISRSTETEDLTNRLPFDDQQVDSDDESTLDLIEAKVPALLEAGLKERSKDSTNKNPQKSGDHPAKRT